MKNKPAPCPPKTAVAYARYSSAGQRDVSIDQQLQDIREYAAREGYTIVHEFADHARSGYKSAAARTQFQAMLSAAPQRSFDTVLCWKVDRFGRNRENAAFAKHELRKSGVKVVYVMDKIPEGAAGIITEGMLETLAQWYSANLSENVRRGMNDNASKCLYNGAHVYGYTVGPDRRYVIYEPEAAIVRKVFTMYADGISMPNIAKQLNAAGIHTSTGHEWVLKYIIKMIDNERYIGTYIYGDYRTPGGMPAIIGPDLWEATRQMRERTGKHFQNSPADFLLTGKAFCGHCGRPLIGDSGTSQKSGRYYYYTCQARKAGKHCDKKPIRRELLEDLVINFLLDHCLTDPEVDKVVDAVIAAQEERNKTSPLASMKEELAAVTAKIRNINEAIMNGIWSSSTSSILKELEDTEADLKKDIAVIQYSEKALVKPDRVRFFLERFRKLDRSDPDARRFIIRTFLNSVFVYDDHLKVVINCVEGNATLQLTDLPPDSELDTDRVPAIIYPNFSAVFMLKIG